MSTTSNKVLTFVSATVPVEAALALAHTGGVGVFVGLAAGIVACMYSDDIARVTGKGGSSPLPASTVAASMRAHGSSFGYRLLHGKSTREAPTTFEEVAQEEAQPKDEPNYPAPSLEPIFPLYPEWEVLRLGQIVPTGQRVDPSINVLLGAGAILAGSQGSGKSNAVAIIAEHVGACEMSEILFDMKREYASLLTVVPNGIIAGHPDARSEIGGDRFYPLTLENAAQFASDVMAKGYQAVVDIPSYLTYGDDWNEVARIITSIMRGLMAWSIAQKPLDRLPCLLSFDEAHVFFPQQVEMKQLFEQSVINDLNVAAFNMVNMGRSYGFTMLFSTQRIANIAKWTIGNCQIKVVMRHSVDVDLERCRQEVGKEFADARTIKTLGDGDGFVIGLTPDPLLVHFDMRRSRHDSHTPKIDRVQQRRRLQQARPVVYQPVQASSVQAYDFPGPVAPPPAIQASMPAMPMRPVAQVATRHFTQALSPELQRAYESFEDGMKHRELARRIGVTHPTAGSYIQRLRERGYIDSADRKVVNGKR